MKYAVCTVIEYLLLLAMMVFIEGEVVNAKLACDNININFVNIFVPYIEWCIVYTVQQGSPNYGPNVALFKKIMALFKSKRASFGTPHAYLNARMPRETHFVSGAPLFCYCA